MSVSNEQFGAAQLALLHPEAFERVTNVGLNYQELYEARMADVAEATQKAADPDVTVLIRTRNHGSRIEGLLRDIQSQQFSGEVQLVVVDTESSDGTVDIVQSYGAEVRPIQQNSFNYASSLNVGFEAAAHPYVLTLVGHSHLPSNQTFRSITRHQGEAEFAGAYGAALPDTNATLGDIAISLLQHNSRRLAPAELLKEWRSGAMVAHRSVVSREAWQELGGYDETFGNGGEDTDFGRRMLASGMTVVREPGLSVHHSYGLNLMRTIRHIRKLQQLRSVGPAEFTESGYRNDMSGYVAS